MSFRYADIKRSTKGRETAASVYLVPSSWLTFVKSVETKEICSSSLEVLSSHPSCSSVSLKSIAFDRICQIARMKLSFQEFARRTYGALHLPRELRQPQWVERAHAFLLEFPEYSLTANPNDGKPRLSKSQSSPDTKVRDQGHGLPQGEAHVESAAPAVQPSSPFVANSNLPPSSASEAAVQEEAQQRDTPKYASGPCRIIYSEDGPAMLLTKSLFTDVSWIIQLNRNLDLQEQQYQSVQKVVNGTERFMESSEYKIESSENEDDKIMIRQDMEQREHTHRKNLQRREELEHKVRDMRDTLEYMRGLFLDTFENVLRGANLLDIPDIVAEENQAISQPQRPTSESDLDLNQDEELSPAPESIVHPQSDEEFIVLHNSMMMKRSERIAILKEVERTRQALFQAQDVFDSTRGSQELDKIEFRSLAAQGITAGFSEEELDLAHFEKTSENTRALVIAEEEHKKAKAVARKFGILENQLDQESDFVDESEDGYCDSQNGNLEAVPDLSYVGHWTNEVIDAQNPFALSLQELQPDDWEFRAVAMFDTRSCVDLDEDHQRRINHWQETMIMEREECRIQKEQMSLKRRDSLPPLESRKRLKNEHSDQSTFVRRGSCSELPGSASERVKLVTYNHHTIDAIFFPNPAIDR